MADTFQRGEVFALRLDARDPLASLRERFVLPDAPAGGKAVYLCGNSLGLAPRQARAEVVAELDAWEALAVRGHLEAERPWYTYHEAFRESLARLVGANPDEVVVMNGLTVNLHLCLASFYKPSADRFGILVEAPTFPSDRYAVQSQLRLQDRDPAAGLLTIAPEPGSNTIRTESIEALLAESGQEIALVLLSGVNFFTGQLFDMQRITAAAHDQGCLVGFDLAHAAGNVPLQLHDWDVDFAVWCHYKYLNAGPGAVGGCFIHQRHARNPDLPRMAGWWGNDPHTRFRLQLEPEFVARSSADGWQISNPSVLAMAPLHASLSLFDEAGMPALREKSIRLTGYLEFLLDGLGADCMEIITPRDPSQRGCQLSLRFKGVPDTLFEHLQSAGVVCDLRKPDVIRVAPAPLYNSFHDVWAFSDALARGLGLHEATADAQ